MPTGGDPKYVTLLYDYSQDGYLKADRTYAINGYYLPILNELISRHTTKYGNRIATIVNNRQYYEDLPKKRFNGH